MMNKTLHLDEILERLRLESCPTLHFSSNLYAFLELLKHDFYILDLDNFPKNVCVSFTYVPMPRSTVGISISSTGSDILTVNFPNDGGKCSFSAPLMNFSKAKYDKRVFRFIIPLFDFYRIVYFSDDDKALVDILRTYSILERLEPKSPNNIGAIYREVCNKRKE